MSLEVRLLMRKLITIAPLVLCLVLTGCSKLLDLLDVVAVTAAAAPPAVLALETAGQLSAKDGNAILALVQTVTADTTKAIADAQSGKPTAEITAAIFSDYKNLPTEIPGLSPKAAAIVQGVVSAVDAVLAMLNPAKVTPAVFTFSPASKRKLDTIKKKCDDAGAAAYTAWRKP